jgi:hypothetical protein
MLSLQSCRVEVQCDVEFLHFLQVAHETEVKAQIKLRFVTSSGQPVVVVRSFQVTGYWFSAHSFDGGSLPHGHPVPSIETS